MGKYISGAATGAGGTKKTELKQLVVNGEKKYVFFIFPKLYNMPVNVLYVSMHLHKNAPKVLNSFKGQFNLSESIQKYGTFKLILKSIYLALVP